MKVLQTVLTDLQKMARRRMMPTQRFLNLRPEKQQVILKAAANEFSRTSYTAASINQIIKEAGISRGSFYTYFEDKDDLMCYMLRGFGIQCRRRVFEILEEEKGNLFSVPCRLLKEIMEGKQDTAYKLYRNILTDMNVVSQNHFFGVKGLMLRDEGFLCLLDELREAGDAAKLPASKEELACVAELCILVFLKGLTMHYKELASREEILQITETQMQILEYGSCRETGKPLSRGE